MTNKRFRVQKLPVHNLHTLHQPILPASSQTSRENTPIIQRPPSEGSTVLTFPPLNTSLILARPLLQPFISLWSVPDFLDADLGCQLVDFPEA
jgi:hypothetical protein